MIILIYIFIFLQARKGRIGIFLHFFVLAYLLLYQYIVIIFCSLLSYTQSNTLNYTKIHPSKNLGVFLLYTIINHYLKSCTLALGTINQLLSNILLGIILTLLLLPQVVSPILLLITLSSLRKPLTKP